MNNFNYIILIIIIIIIILLLKCIMVTNVDNVNNVNIKNLKNKRKNDKILLVHFDSVKSRKILIELKARSNNVIEYNPYIENLTKKKLESYKRCSGLVISGNNPDLKTVELPRIRIDPFGRSFYDRIKRIIDLFQDKKILSICYGSQLLWHYYGGTCNYHEDVYGYRVGSNSKKIYMKTPRDRLLKGVHIDNKMIFFRNILLSPDSVPKNVSIISLDETLHKGNVNKNISGYRVNNKNIWGVIFHPESSRDGKIIFDNYMNI